MNMSRTFVCVNNLRKGAARMDESDEAFAVVYTKIQHLKLLRMNWNKTIFQVCNHQHLGLCQIGFDVIEMKLGAVCNKTNFNDTFTHTNIPW